MRQYAEAYVQKADDQTLTELLLAAQKFARMAKIFAITGCPACRQRKIDGSETLTTLAHGGDKERLAQALADFHRVSEPESVLDLVMSYASVVGDPTVAREAIAQLGRWMHLPAVRHRIMMLSTTARALEVRVLATQLLWSCDLHHPVDAAVALTPSIAKLLPSSKPTPETYRAWVMGLPRVRVYVDKRRPLAELRAASSPAT